MHLNILVFAITEALKSIRWSSFSSSLFFFYHAQVVAITVFFLLSVAYYAFFAPFLGNDIYEYAAIGVYSVLVSSILTFTYIHYLFHGQNLICL